MSRYSTERYVTQVLRGGGAPFEFLNGRREGAARSGAAPGQQSVSSAARSGSHAAGLARAGSGRPRNAAADGARPSATQLQQPSASAVLGTPRQVTWQCASCHQMDQRGTTCAVQTYKAELKAACTLGSYLREASGLIPKTSMPQVIRGGSRWNV